MPRKLNGKTMTDREEYQWKTVFEKTGNGAIATAAVQKSRKGNKYSKFVSKVKKSHKKDAL